MKSAFFKVGKRVINQYEIRDVYIDELGHNAFPIAIITYKDGSKVRVSGCRVIMFQNWLLGSSSYS
jgi:hypothetical protein